MRRTNILFFALLFSINALYTQELEISGEIKTGFYMETEQIGELDARARGGMRNSDGDSGVGEGRIRLNFHYSYEDIGVKVNFQLDPAGVGPFEPAWNYAYAYGNLFNNQLSISAGILGESPWGTGGHKLRRELESRETVKKVLINNEICTETEGLVGIRFEYKPSFIPGLNIGFVLNQPDQVVKKAPNEQTFTELLQESVIGIAYKNEFFAVNAGYRFDSEVDLYRANDKNEGGRITYRIEESFLKNFIPGMKIWLNGYYYGLGCEQFDVPRVGGYNPDGTQIIDKMGGGERFLNWLYWLWDAENFTAKLDVGFSMYMTYFNQEFIPQVRQEYQSLEFIPALYFKFLSNRLQAGLAAGFGMEFGPGKIYQDSAYQYYAIEPQIRLNINNNSYIALVYNYTNSYATPTIDYGEDKIQRGDISQKHWINLRAVYTF